VQKFARTAKIPTKFAGDYFAFTRYTKVLYTRIVMSVQNDPSINQSINQSVNHLRRAIVQRRVLQCGYAESKRNVLRRILNVLTDGAVRQFSGREFQSLGAATEKRRAAVSKLCGGTDRSFCVDDRS